MENLYNTYEDFIMIFSYLWHKCILLCPRSSSHFFTFNIPFQMRIHSFVSVLAYFATTMVCEFLLSYCTPLQFSCTISNACLCIDRYNYHNHHTCNRGCNMSIYHHRRQGCISCGTCSYLELTEDHVLTSALVKIFRIVTRNAVNKSF